MARKCFTKPYYEVVRFSSGILTASTCGCFDADFCSTNYTNCTGDGAVCTCGTNYSPALDNCIPCPNYTP